MSTGLNAIQQVHFVAATKAAYQNGSLLRGTTQIKEDVIGGTAKFRRTNRGVSIPRITQTPLIPMGTTHAEVIATLTNWQAVEYIDKQDFPLVNFNEALVIAKNIGSATGRRYDQMIIDALESAKASADIPHGSTGMTFSKLVELRKKFRAAGVPEEDRCLLLEAEGEADLLEEAKLTSKDYVDRAVVETGKLPPRLMGFNIIVLDAARDEGGMTYTAGSPNVQKAYAWDKEAMGVALGGWTDVEEKEVPHMNSMQYAQFLRVGAIAVDTAGIFEIEYTV